MDTTGLVVVVVAPMEVVVVGAVVVVNVTELVGATVVDVDAV